MLDFDRPSLKNRQVGDLEFALFASLNPVEPDPEFLTRVRTRIETATEDGAWSRELFGKLM